MRQYRYLVERAGLRFEIIVTAANDDHATAQAAEIGMSIGLMLIGPL